VTPDFACKGKHSTVRSSRAADAGKLTVDERNVSRYVPEEGYSARIVRVEGAGSSLVRVTVDAKGKSGFRHPKSSCLRNETGSEIRRVTNSEFSVEKPGEFFGTLDFEAEAGDGWFFQYSCRDDYTMVKIDW